MTRDAIRRTALVGAGLAVASIALLAVRARWFFPLGLESLGSRIGNVALGVQLAALVAGVVTINLVAGRPALWLLAAEGVVCLLAHGVAGLAYCAAIALWYGVFAAAWLGRARIVIAGLLLVAMNACAWAARDVAAAALTFSMILTMRLVVHAWDRMQNDYEPMDPLEYAAFTLIPPLAIIPPYMTIIPLASGFAAKVRPGLTPNRLRSIARHFGLAALFGGMRGLVELAGLDHSLAQPAEMYWRFLEHVLDAATFAHALIALLLLHGIEERLPLFRPLLATRFIQYWNRFQVHQKDAQVFLFFTPAVLRLRRWNRYLTIVAATAWTMIIGNTLIHIVTRYCFLPSPWYRIKWVLVSNVVMTIALAADLCLDERRRQRGVAVTSSAARSIAGWVITMTLAAIAATL